MICAAGGQAALAGKTMVDMGYTNVVNAGGLPIGKPLVAKQKNKSCAFLQSCLGPL